MIEVDINITVYDLDGKNIYGTRGESRLELKGGLIAVQLSVTEDNMRRVLTEALNDLRAKQAASLEEDNG